MLVLKAAASGVIGEYSNGRPNQARLKDEPVRGRLAYDLRGYSRDGRAGCNVLQNHTACAHFGTLTNTNIAQEGCAGAEQHVLTDFGMAIAFFVSSAAQGDPMEKRDVVIDHRGFADHDTRRVIKHKSTAQGHRGVDVNAKQTVHLALKVEG